MSTNTQLPLILFAKEPIVGKVKTRLHSHCSPSDATHIAKIILKCSLRNAIKNWPGKVILSVGLGDQASIVGTFTNELARKCNVQIVRQVEGSLGERMNSALTEFGYPAVVMGADVPHCPRANFNQAWTQLKLGRDIIGPCEDGGYYLIGLQQKSDALFNNITWGSDQVLNQTLCMAKDENLKFVHLTELYDLDYWQDLERLVRSQPEFLPELANFVKEKTKST